MHAGRCTRAAQGDANTSLRLQASLILALQNAWRPDSAYPRAGYGVRGRVGVPVAQGLGVRLGDSLGAASIAARLRARARLCARLQQLAACSHAFHVW